jgi:hypothetical protein
MLKPDQVEKLICLVSQLDREKLAEQFRSYPARFPVDFSDDFLNKTPVDRLRHIFLAMCLQNQRMPLAA